MFDLKRLMDPDTLRRHEHAEAEKKRFREMSLAELIATVEHYRSNARPPTYGDGTVIPEGAPVYDAAIWYLLMPELIERLKAVVADQQQTDVVRITGLLTKARVVWKYVDDPPFTSRGLIVVSINDADQPKDQMPFTLMPGTDIVLLVFNQDGSLRAVLPY